MAEITVDGASHSFSVRTRGWWIWGRRVYELSLGERLRVTSYGISPRGPAHPALGIELALESDAAGRGTGGSIRRTLPITGVVGLDRRDELEALTHRLAVLLGRKHRSVAEDLRWYSCELGEHGEEPRSARIALGYRDGATRRLDVSRQRSFEAPRWAPPPLESVDGGELRAGFRREGDRLRVAPERLPRWLWFGLGLATLLCAAIAGWGTSGEGRLVAVTMGALLPFGALLLGALFAWIGRSMLSWAFRGLRWALGGSRAALPRSPWCAVTSGFVLEGEVLRLRRLTVWPSTVRRGAAGVLLLIDRRRQWQTKSSDRTRHRSWRELWLFEEGRWTLLTRGRQTEEPHPGSCPTLDAIAFELGRRLDLPVRATLD